MQRSGIDTIKYHTLPRIPMGKWQTHRLFCHSKQCRHWCNVALCSISSGSSLFAIIHIKESPVYKRLTNKHHAQKSTKKVNIPITFPMSRVTVYLRWLATVEQPEVIFHSEGNNNHIKCKIGYHTTLVSYVKSETWTTHSRTRSRQIGPPFHWSGLW